MPKQQQHQQDEEELIISFPVSVGSTPRDTSPDSFNHYASNTTTSLFSSYAPSPSNDVTNVAFSHPDPRKFRMMLNDTLIINQPTQGVPGMKSRVVEEDGNESERLSFTLAVKECLKRREDSLQRISVDLNNSVAAYSPQFGRMKNSSVLKHCSGALTSPATPIYQHTCGGVQKSWSSERVALPQNGIKRQISAGHFAFNQRGALPSKWEDAERWIFGPVTSNTSRKQSVPPTQTQPRSKSGPLGPSGVSYNLSISTAKYTFDGIHGGDHLAGSQISAGIMAGDILRTDHGSKNIHSASAHRRTTEQMNHFSIPHSPQIDEEHGDVKAASTDISRAISRRDMATQMSPEGSLCSSSRRKHSISSTVSTGEMHSNNSPRIDVRDVEVNKRVAVTRWFLKNKSHHSGKGTENVDDLTSKNPTRHSSAWEVSETAKNISMVRKEEARITAWENLQKAKAEAAVKKLEMKLEKKRSSSMDKIMNKLRLAQKKSQEIRRTVLANQAQQVSSSSNRTISLRLARPMSSLSSCFKCHAF